MVYLILVPAILFLPLITDKIEKGKNIYFFIVTALLIFFAGCRHYTVGTDTPSYVSGFLSSGTLADLNWSSVFSKNEFLYVVYRNLIHSVTNNYLWYLLPISLFYISVVARMIFKYSDSPTISFLAFLSMSYYAFSMAGIRQTIGYALLLLATEALMNRKRILCCIYILIAGGFHITSLLYFTVFVIDIIPLSLAYLGFIVIASGVCYVYAMTFTSFFVEIFEKSETLNKIDYGGNIVLLVVILVSVAALLLHPDIFKKAHPDIKPNGKTCMSELQREQFFMKMVLFSIPLLVMVLFQANIFRIAAMFHFYMMFLIPAVIKRQESPHIRVVGQLLVFAALLAELFVFTYNAAEIFPYSFSF